MDAMLSESDNRNPMICFLSMGSDPTENIERLAKSKSTRELKYSRVSSRYVAVSKSKHAFAAACRAISMGQGQEVHARRLLTQCFQDGGWLLLQNCHLGLEYMDELLENVCTFSTVSEVDATSFFCAKLHEILRLLNIIPLFGNDLYRT